MKKNFTHGIDVILIILTLLLPCSFRDSGNNLKAQETGSFTDQRDGKIYKTVKIGNQWLMAENFAFKPDHGKYWAYGNDAGNVAIYGYLYDWETAKNIAPNGWHLPSKEEWKNFRKALGSRMDIGFTMSKVYDQMVSGGSSGFNALFGGAYIIANNEFRGIGKVAYFWSSSETSDGPTNYFVDGESGTAFLTNYADSRGGKSVRLFKD
ncbi:MAG: hypothetical protein FD155_352 [Bacteroidetes bacterium]|nr:MAG: hypothetical protein FD155_352 [Bacteroidota bacterium]